VLAGLVVRLRPTPEATRAALPFRWLCEDDTVLRYEVFDRSTAKTCQSVLKPDAIVEVPGRERRLFIEAETGTQSIATAHPGRNGAIVSKLSRYYEFFHRGARLDETWYERAFDDAFVPRIVFLVHSDERRERVSAAVKAWVGSNRPGRFNVLVYTFAEAAKILAPYIVSGTLHAPAPVRAMRVVSMDLRKAEELRDGYNQLVEALRATQDAVKRNNATPGAAQVPLPAVRLDAVRALHEFIHQQLSVPTTANRREAQRSGARHA
jgi:hypothetical protein